MDVIPLELSHNWGVPAKKIYSGRDLPSFHKSLAFLRINKAILIIAKQISGIDIPSSSSVCDLSPAAAAISSILKDFLTIHHEIPPLAGPRRYGNLAARDWHAKIELQGFDIIKRHLQATTDSSINLEPFLNESTPYLLNSFGSSTRLDYGTGHELSFVAWLGSLYMTQILPLDTPGDALLIIFNQYYNLVQELIVNYTLEPAGSHGVWGLDDHFHLSYFFGACQMIKYSEVFPSPELFHTTDSPTMKNPTNQSLPSIDETNTLTPQSHIKDEKELKSISKQTSPLPYFTLNTNIIKALEETNFYFKSLAFIYKVKRGPFQEHSPVLYNIAATKTWEKVARGLWRMYADEVIGKWPVVQHFWFGKVLYPWVIAPDANGNPSCLYSFDLESKWSELPSTLGNDNSTSLPVTTERTNESSFPRTTATSLGGLSSLRDTRGSGSCRVANLNQSALRGRGPPQRKSGPLGQAGTGNSHESPLPMKQRKM